MKKISAYFFIILLGIVIFLLGFDYKIGKQPNTYYQVYLDNEFMGIIESKKELEDYINNQAETIRENVRNYTSKIEAIETVDRYKDSLGERANTISEKISYLIDNRDSYQLTDADIENMNLYLKDKLYTLSNVEIQEMKDYTSSNDIYIHVSDVYTPNGIEIKKVYTYHDDIVSVEEIYKDIILKKSCTISGYKFTIKSNTEGYDDIDIYTLDTKIFSDAIDDMITIFVDSAKYEAYKNSTQPEIATTGSIIENIYVEQDITYKAVNIPVEEKIYISSKDLSRFLLYGNQYEESIVQVKSGDSIESLAFENEVSVQEFLISNPQYTSRDNLLVVGADVKISKIDPKIQIVEELYEVVDKETNFSTVEQYDESINQGTVVVTQQGENGMERVSQNVKIVNGEISYVDPVGKETIKSAVPKVITIGSRYVPDIGSVTSWGWPTNPGYTLSSYYGYRPQVFGEGNFHSGLDIAGTGYGSPVYASNNGEIIGIGWHPYGLGNYIKIDHHNGYFSEYGHMSGFASGMSIGTIVERGQTIGYVGSTGWSTGPHLHFEIHTCPKDTCHVNPLPYLLK